MFKRRLILICILIAFLALGCRRVDGPPVESQSLLTFARYDEVIVTATGSAGAAAGTGTSTYVCGNLYALHLDFAATISNTTDITITQATPALTVLALTDNYTDTWYYPAAQQTGSDGTGTSTYARLPVCDQLTLSIAESTAGTLVTMTVLWGQ